jgi:hypothetical protein
LIKITEAADRRFDVRFIKVYLTLYVLSRYYIKNKIPLVKKVQPIQLDKLFKTSGSNFKDAKSILSRNGAYLKGIKTQILPRKTSPNKSILHSNQISNPKGIRLFITPPRMLTSK